MNPLNVVIDKNIGGGRVKIMLAFMRNEQLIDFRMKRCATFNNLGQLLRSNSINGV